MNWPATACGSSLATLLFFPTRSINLGFGFVSETLTFLPTSSCRGWTQQVLSPSFAWLNMNSQNWNILCWNVRGFNGSDKWNVVRSKIEESGCSIICIQESKREVIDTLFIRNFAPRKFDSFDYIPSIGASGGLLVIWASSVFIGKVLEKTSFSITLDFP